MHTRIGNIFSVVSVIFCDYFYNSVNEYSLPKLNGYCIIRYLTIEKNIHMYYLISIVAKRMATDAHRKFIVGFYHMICTNINQPLPHYLENLKANMGGIISADQRCEYLKKYTLAELRELLYSFILFDDLRKDKQLHPNLKLAIKFIEKDLAAQEHGKHIHEKSEQRNKKDWNTPVTTENNSERKEICGEYGNFGLGIAIPGLEHQDTSFQKLVLGRNSLITSNQDLRMANKSLNAENMLHMATIKELRSNNDLINLQVTKYKEQLEKEIKRISDIKDSIGAFIG